MGEWEKARHPRFCLGQRLFIETYGVEVRHEQVHSWRFLGDCAVASLISGARWRTHSGVGKDGRGHLFRHTMATLMPEGGADIRFFQQILGHAHLSTTEIYTYVAIHKLKSMHEATHPARLPEGVAERVKGSDNPTDPEPTADDVLDALEREDDDDEEAE